MIIPITCVIITLNEAKHISDCITSVKEVVHEIIVIDAESSDATVSLAQQAGAKVVVRKWNGYGATRNYGAQMASNNWILSIDADERLSPELIDNIKKLAVQETQVYSFNRLTNYCNQWIRHGTWYPEWKSRLYNSKNVYWSDHEVHEKLQFSLSCTTVKLQGNIYHYAYATHKELDNRLTTYAKLYKTELTKKNISPHWTKRTFSPVAVFIKSYFLKLGFLDGKAGFMIAKALKNYTLKKYS